MAPITDNSATMAALTSATTRRPVSLRAIVVGLLGVLWICGLTPYSDYAMGNTYVVGNFLPIGLLLFYFTLVLLVNAPLARWLPSRAFTTGELAVALAMTLMSCAIPSSGLMRYLPASLVGFYHHAATDFGYRELLGRLDLPQWMFPRVSPSAAGGRATDPVIEGYWYRAAIDGTSFADHWRAVPWGAWARPAIVWGLLLAALYGAVLCLSVIVRRQWVENERLPFPLATVYLALIEAPPPGKSLNNLLSSTAFWIAFASVFIIHGINGLHTYLPQFVPQIPIGYDMWDLLGSGPLRYTQWTFKANTIYFSIIGVCFFIQTRIAFSLWAFYLLFQLITIFYGSYEADFTPAMQQDQTFGALAVFCGMILWIGRQHWALVVRQMLRGRRADEPRDPYLPYSVAGWGFFLCCAAVIAWLLCAGASLAGALVIVLMLMLLFLGIARVVAETGLIFAQLPVPVSRPWIFALGFPTSPRTTAKSFFFASYFHEMFTHDLRESLPVFATHALRLGDGANVAEGANGPSRSKRSGLAFILCLILALAAGYLIAGASTLYVEYTHAVMLDRQQSSPLNSYGVDSAVRELILDPTNNYLPPRTGPADTHSRAGHFILGALLTTVLSVLRLRFAAWPLYPVGFLLAYSYPMGRIWFSIFLGWLLKATLVRFGGSKLYTASRPFFLGLILGEAGAAACWLLVALARNFMHLQYHAVNLLPG
ncbi:MAG TPA: DUF6785 family protein [Tepidisphaeraceae bacterium]|jgi:hypothetical protein